MPSIKIDFTKSDFDTPAEGKLWFVNVSLLHDEVFQRVMDELKNFNLNKSEILKIITLTTIYMKSELELILQRLSPIIKDAIEKRCLFIVKMVETYPLTSSYLSGDFINNILGLIDQLNALISSKYQTESFESNESLKEYLPKIFVYLKTLYDKMKNNFWLNQWLAINGFVKTDISILYHCFFIPVIPFSYIKQFSRKDDETVTDKIEYFCYCKIAVSERVPTSYQNQYFMVECIFDPFKGRYLGMLDMVKYIAKQINPMRYEIKHTVILAKICNKIETIKSITDLSIKQIKN